MGKIMPKKHGLLVIISSPSGGGKDVVINALLKIFPDSARLITTTSRPPRPSQKDGVDYYFISPDDFKNKIKSGDFVEYNNYAGNFYGTQKRHLSAAIQKYSLVLTQIEVNGKRNLDKAQIPHLSIFLLPESLETLKARIAKRGGIAPEIIEERVKIAQNEITRSLDYDYRIVNIEGKLEKTIAQTAEIIRQALAKKDA